MPINELAKRCWDLAEAGKIQEAIELMASVIDLHRDNFVLLLTHANLLRRGRQFESSESIIRDAIRINPNCDVAWAEYGMLMMEQGYFERAAYCFRESARICPDFNTLTLLAEAEIEFDPKAAESSALKAIEINPDWDEARAILKAAREAQKAVGEK